MLHSINTNKMDRTRIQNTRAWIIFVPHACTAFPSSSCRLTMIFRESKINLFKALNIIVIVRLGTQYYKCLSPESSMCNSKSIIARLIQPFHYKRPGGPATDKYTQSLKYSVTDNSMTNSEGFTLLKSFIA